MIRYRTSITDLYKRIDKKNTNWRTDATTATANAAL